MKCSKLPLLLVCFALIAGCACNKPVLTFPGKSSYTIKGKTYHPLKAVKSGFTQSGVASWYGPGFHGKKTASGEIYDMHALTAAHNTLPLNTLLKVTNLVNHKEVLVRVNDRGPFVGDRLIDLSLAAAKKLEIVGPGTTSVQMEVLRDSGTLVASKAGPSPEPSSPPPAPNPFFSVGRHRLFAFLGG